MNANQIKKVWRLRLGVGHWFRKYSLTFSIKLPGVACVLFAIFIVAFVPSVARV